VVVGAGPAGSAAALEAARLGYGSILLIDKAPLGRTKPCGGGISPRARKVLKRMGLWEAVHREAYPIKGLRLVSPGGKEIILAGSHAASVLNRSRFDTILTEAAIREGVVLKPETRVHGIIEEGGRIVGIRSDAGEIRARWTLVANGATSRLVPDPRSVACCTPAWPGSTGSLSPRTSLRWSTTRA